MPLSKPTKRAPLSFLLDENVDIRVAGFLKNRGCPVTLCPKGLNDNDVLALAKRNSQVLITFDKDFASPDLYRPAGTTGIIVLRVHPPKLKSIQLLLKNLLDSVPVDKFSETLFVATETGVEIIQT